MTSILSREIDRKLDELDKEGREPTPDLLASMVLSRNTRARREAAELGATIRAQYRIRARSRNPKRRQAGEKQPLRADLEEFISSNPEVQEEQLVAWLAERPRKK